MPLHTPQLRRPKRLLLAVALSVGLMSSAGCSPSMARFAAAAFVGTAAAVMILAAHDAHYHDAYCGHQVVVVEDRPVYYYQGHWEYYDPDTGEWYVYREPPVRYRYR